jgi:hypothetical protein
MIGAGNDIAGRFSTRLIRPSEYRQVSAIAGELVRVDFAIANRGQLAAQQLDRCAMFRRRTLEIDNSNPRTRLQGGGEVIKEGVGLGYLMIHVHEDGRIQRRGGQTRVMWVAEREYDIW